MSVPKISVYSLPDLKNTSDDALPNYLNSLGFVQSHYYTDVRLALGYAAVAIAGALFYFDWQLGWDVTRAWTLPAVVTYTLLNGVFTYWLFRVEQGTVYVGTRQGVELRIATTSSSSSSSSSSSAGAHDGVPVYKVTARTRKNAGATTWVEKQVEAPLSSWFSKDGYFVAKPFQQFLARNIVAVGEADPKNASSAAAAAEPVVQIKSSSSSSSANNNKNNSSGSSTGGQQGNKQQQQQNFNVNISNLPEVLKHIQAQGGATKRK